jgi:gamma-butyrobetaine dioxygenase
MFRRKLHLAKNTLELKSKSLVVGLPERTEFHYSWLRDNCRCPQCVHPSTQQKLISSGQIGQPKPSYVNLLKNKIEITWPPTNSSVEHKTIINLNYLKKHNYNNKFEPCVQYKPWNSEQFKARRKTLHFNTFNTPDGFKNALEQLHYNGLLFLENVPTEDTKIVESIAKMFGTINNTFYGESWDVKNVKDSKNIAYTPLFLGLHMDLMYFEAPPGLQLLHCLKNKVNGYIKLT